MKVLGLIPARGGSKRLKNKNILWCFGKPLIAWTIEAAQKSALITEYWVTTEDANIAKISRDFGAQVIDRPPELAKDDTPTEAAVNHALTQLVGFDWICLLQPTSPTRTAEAIDRCLELAIKYDKPVFSTNDQRTSNGAIYIWKADSSLSEAQKGGAIWFPLHCIDINTGLDFAAAADALNLAHCEQASAGIRPKEWWMNV